MNKKSGEIALLTDSQQAVLLQVFESRELQTTQHTTPPTAHRQKIIYSKTVEDFKRFATETSVALISRSVTNGFEFGKCFLKYSFEFLLFLSPN
jgi:hypothetical protein